MKSVIQRVKKASVDIEGKIVGQIDVGLLVLLGVESKDTIDNVTKMLDKIIGLRIFEDENGKMNKSLLEVQGSLLVVSQFTLAADTKGRRPSFSKGAPPALANELYEVFVEQSSKLVNTQTGVFAADMQISLQNDGPVTFVLEN